LNATRHRVKGREVPVAIATPKPQVLAYTTLRLAIGMSMLIHGVDRVVAFHQFAEKTAKMFADSRLPRLAVMGFVYTVPPIELTIGVLVLFGLFTRTGLLMGGLWMVVLIFGSSLIEQFDVVGIQLVYSLIFSSLLYYNDANRISIDHWLGRI
jgi:thiosulfate dehydrogenase (quinone) large subunit